MDPCEFQDNLALHIEFQVLHNEIPSQNRRDKEGERMGEGGGGEWGYS